jgi:spermidine synthase
VASIQTTSPLNARKSFWCINKTLEAAGFSVRPMHASVPSFGDWGYALATSSPRPEPTTILKGLRYLDASTLPSLFAFGPDLARLPVEINRLNNQILVRYYQEELAAWQ